MTSKKEFNVNECDDIEQLMSLPGIGQKTAKLILKERLNKPFTSSHDLIRRIKGLSQCKINKISEKFNLIFNDENESIQVMMDEMAICPYKKYYQENELVYLALNMYNKGDFKNQDVEWGIIKSYKIDKNNKVKVQWGMNKFIQTPISYLAPIRYEQGEIALSRKDKSISYQIIEYKFDLMEIPKGIDLNNEDFWSIKAKKYENGKCIEQCVWVKQHEIVRKRMPKHIERDEISDDSSGHDTQFSGLTQYHVGISSKHF